VIFDADRGAIGGSDLRIAGRTGNTTLNYTGVIDHVVIRSGVWTAADFWNL
jgi:hypothetical protein